MDRREKAKGTDRTKRKNGNEKSLTIGLSKKRKSDIAVNIPQTGKDCDANWKILLRQLKHEANEKSDKAKQIKGRRDKSKSVKLVKTNLKAKQEEEIWFDDVPVEEILLAERTPSEKAEKSAQSCSTDQKLIKPHAFGGLTKAIGMDCEMVGTGHKGSHSVLARVSLVNQYGKCIYDKHVKATEKVTDYRTWVSGIRPSDLSGAEEFEVVQREVAEILKGRILVGHALQNDLRVLYLAHPKKWIRDTSEYKPFRVHNGGKTPSLRTLSNKVLGIQVQKGEHSSVQDAQAAMKLYMMHKKQWEKELKLAKAVKS